jgi:hypothetical protein
MVQAYYLVSLSDREEPVNKRLIAFFLLISISVNAQAALIPPKAVVLAVSDAARTQLKSGIGEGVFEMTGPGKEPTRYSLKVVHAGEKFRAELTYLDGDAVASLPKTLVVIYDGETLAYREISLRFRPFGEEARLFKVKPTEFGRSGPFFRFNPANLSALNLTGYLRNRPDTTFEYTLDGVFASFELKKPLMKFEVQFPKSAGYNVGSYEAQAIENGYKYAATAKWEKSKDVWYVRELETKHMRKDKPSQFERLTYKSYEANPKLDNTHFTLPALGLVAGARLIFMDFETKGTDIYTSVVPAPGGGADDTLIDALKRLPLSDSIRPPVKEKK